MKDGESVAYVPSTVAAEALCQGLREQFSDNSKRSPWFEVVPMPQGWSVMMHTPKVFGAERRCHVTLFVRGWRAHAGELL